MQWALNAQTLLACGRDLDPRAVFAVAIDPRTSDAAQDHVVKLTQGGVIRLRELTVDGGIFFNDRVRTLDQWRSLGRIESNLDVLLRGHAGLECVHVWGCPVGHVLDALSGLRHLRSIQLAGVWPDHLPDWLFLFPDLRILDLTFNDLVDLPSAVGEARQLTSLILRNNSFTQVPEGVWNLSGLEALDMEGCPLVEIPDRVLRLRKLKTLTFGRGYGTELSAGFLRPPPEIAAQGLDAIKNYWRQEREAGADYLAEAKLLIVGESGAGKTTLAKKLLDPGYVLDSGEQSTEGIDVHAWQFPSAIRTQRDGGEDVLPCTFRANVWDFGGQEIYHATHQFFLTRRSVYVLVTDERKEDTDFEYWLEVVNLLSDGSPIVIVQNQKQGRQHGVDFGDLRRRYPNLRQPAALNLADGTGLRPAVTQIRRELEQLPHIGAPLPKTWRDVRVALESDPRDHVSSEEFFRLCERHGFRRREDMLQLGGYLHDLGICLFFQDDELLSRTVVLNPEWGTSAVYRVLDDPAIADQLGVFGRADLQRIWHEPAYASMRAELLQLMIRFSLCYRVPGSDTFVAPQLLSPTRPAYNWDEPDLVMRYEYDVMPKGIVRRLIVALHDLIMPGESVWRSGVLLEHDLTRAEVVEEYRRRRLTIRLCGGDPRVLLAIIERELATIHRSYPAIRFERLRPCDCDRCTESSEPSMFTIRDLLDFAKDGARIQCRVSRGLRDPVALLNELYLDPAGAIDPGAASSPAGPVQPEVFVSYHWGGDADALVDQIQERMSENGVHVTRDRDEVNYRDSIEQFMRRLGAGKAVVVVIDKAYLRSRNCMFELTRIAQDPRFAERIFPVVLADAGIFDAVDRVEHVKYWEDKRDKLDAAMRSVGQENLHGIREELDLYEAIRNTIAGILNVLGDMNTLTEQQHRDSGFEQLYRSLQAAVQPRKNRRSG